ncbi:MAG TPA: sulfite exporter TauE/SafE family protein [Phycisphaerales bacterium]|nr:sulfite exporter TauE/SafE family protein [Phycisphaerales bacterium]
MQQYLPILFGLIVGISLGLTGGGGSILAVPLLIFGLGLEAHLATSVSLAAVGFTALFGAVQRFLHKEIDLRIAIIFSLGGLLGVPAGKMIGKGLNDSVFLFLFSALMLIIAVRMWRRKPRAKPGAAQSASAESGSEEPSGFSLWKLIVAGIATGLLAGLFGIGGGFIIVPALVLFAGVEIHRAVASSLMVIAVLGIEGFLHGLFLGEEFPRELTAWFVLGGVAGMLAGTAISRRLSAQKLQKVFAVIIIGVAVLTITKTALNMREKAKKSHELPATSAETQPALENSAG